MTRRLISSGSFLEESAGYSRAVVDGDWVFVSGCTGQEYGTGTIVAGVAAQTHQTFQNIEWALNEAGASLKDVVRVTYYITERADVPTVLPIFGQYFGDIRPASTLIVCGLVREELKIEIEVTARLPQTG